STGVVHFYITEGVPDANRVLLDAWVAEAQIIGGGMYFAAVRGMRGGFAGKGLSIAGALTILTYVVPFIPMLFIRAPVMFRIPPIVYGVLSAFILMRVARSPRPNSPSSVAAIVDARAPRIFD